MEADSICFASNRPATDEFTVDYLVPPAMKLHHTIYDIVTKLLSTEQRTTDTNGNTEKKYYGRSLLPIVTPLPTPEYGEGRDLPLPIPESDSGPLPIPESNTDSGTLPIPETVTDSGQLPIPESDSGPLLIPESMTDSGPDDISVMFHDGTTQIEQQNVMNHFHETIHTLGNYDFSLLDQFFWSSSSTLNYFMNTINTMKEHSSNQEHSMKLDDIIPYADRAALWSKSIQYLSQKVQADSMPGSVSDPCLLHSVPVIEKEVN